MKKRNSVPGASGRLPSQTLKASETTCLPTFRNHPPTQLLLSLGMSLLDQAFSSMPATAIPATTARGFLLDTTDQFCSAHLGVWSRNVPLIFVQVEIKFTCPAE